MSRTWYDEWQQTYAGSEDEQKNFREWYETTYRKPYQADWNTESVLETYRGSPIWFDQFLDWAHEQETE